jgi:hypothetical protein
MSIEILSQNRKAAQISYEVWLISRNVDTSKKFVTTAILAFDFEFFIGVCCDLLGNMQIQYTRASVDAVQ